MTVKNIAFISITTILLGVNIKIIDIIINTPFFWGAICNIFNFYWFFYEMCNFAFT